MSVKYTADKHQHQLPLVTMLLFTGELVALNKVKTYQYILSIYEVAFLPVHHEFLFHSMHQQTWKGWSLGISVTLMTSVKCPKKEERRWELICR